MREWREGQYEKVIEQYRGLVWKLAWQYWWRLPVQAKCWVDPDDLIEDAYLYVLTTVAKGTYDRRRGGKTTFLWVGVNNLLLNFALSLQAKKRVGWVVSLEELHAVAKADRELGRVEAEEALNRTYRDASVSLKKEMKNWFGPGKPKVRRSKEAKGLQGEFLDLARRNRLTAQDCRELMGTGTWYT